MEVLINGDDRADEVVDARGQVRVVRERRDQALDQATSLTVSLAAIDEESMEHPLIAFSVMDQVTTGSGVIRSVVLGVVMKDGMDPDVLQDWEILNQLNLILGTRNERRLRNEVVPENYEEVRSQILAAHQVIDRYLPIMELPFNLPLVAPLAVFWPTFPVG